MSKTSSERRRRRPIAVLLIAACRVALGQTAAGPDLDQRAGVVAGGGGVSTAAATEVQGTVGQPSAGTASAGAWRLDGGFWGPLLSPLIFRDGFETGDLSRWSSAVGESTEDRQENGP